MELCLWKFRKIILILLILINFHLNYSNAATLATSAATATLAARNKTATLQQSYASLRDDMRWFFQRLENIASTVEVMLPNATSPNGNDRSLSQDTKTFLLSGIKHLVVGTKELSLTFRRSFETDHVRQFLQLRNLTDFLHDLVKALKNWFSNLRALTAHLFNLYHYYIPEVLFGKCLGKYIQTSYPDNYLYEYPFLLLKDIFNLLLDSLESAEPSDPSPFGKQSHPLDSSSIAENEISYTDLDRLAIFNEISEDPLNIAQKTDADDSLFNLSEVLDPNKDAIISKAAEEHSLKKCLKLYTAESLMRQLKLYFLS